MVHDVVVRGRAGADYYRFVIRIDIDLLVRCLALKPDICALLTSFKKHKGATISLSLREVLTEFAQHDD